MLGWKTAGTVHQLFREKRGRQSQRLRGRHRSTLAVRVSPGQPTTSCVSSHVGASTYARKMVFCQTDWFPDGAESLRARHEQYPGPYVGRQRISSSGLDRAHQLRKGHPDHERNRSNLLSRAPSSPAEKMCVPATGPKKNVLPSGNEGRSKSAVTVSNRSMSGAS